MSNHHSDISRKAVLEGGEHSVGSSRACAESVGSSRACAEKGGGLRLLPTALADEWTFAGPELKRTTLRGRAGCWPGVAGLLALCCLMLPACVWPVQFQGKAMAATDSPTPEEAASPTPLSPEQALERARRPVVQPFHPFLPPNRVRGCSIGTTRDGYLVHGVALPLPHEGLRVMDRQLSRGLIFGTPGMVSALVEVAEVVRQAHPGSVLSLGHLSAPLGGDIPWSVSHNAGRDADIAFFYQDKSGQPVLPADFVELNHKGRSADGTVYFDAARTWTVVRTLLLSPDVQVQWLFISTPLRAALLEHARALEESPELIARAEEILGQPGDSRPHNDHLHLRILCSESDLMEGCQNTGRIPMGVRPDEPLVLARVQEVRGYLSHPEPEFRARAAELLGILRDVNSFGQLLRLLNDPQPRVKVGATRGLELLLPWMGHGLERRFSPERMGQGSPGMGVSDPGAARVPGSDGAGGLEAPGELPDEREESMVSAEGDEGGPVHSPDEGPTVDEAVAQTRVATALLERLPQQNDPTVIEVWVAALVRMRAPEAVPVLRGFLRDERWFARDTRLTEAGGGMPRDPFAGAPWLASRGVPLALPLHVRAVAAVGLAELGDWESLPGVASLLKDPAEEVQQAAAFALSLLLNRSLSVTATGTDVDATSLLHAAETSGNRAQWLLDGFKAVGYPVGSLERSAVPALIRALDAPMPQALNAALLLERLTGVQPEYVPATFEDLKIFWGRYFRRNAYKYQPPPAVKASHKGKAGRAAKGKAGKSKATKSKATKSKATKSKATQGKASKAGKASSGKKSSTGSKGKNAASSKSSGKKSQATTRKKK